MTADPQSPGRPADLFRAEALEHRARLRGPGDVVRVAPRWTTVAFYALVGLFGAALVAGLTVEIDRYARGTSAVDDAGRLVVLVPAAVAPDVARGRPVHLSTGTARVVEAGETVLSPAEVGRRFGVDVAVPSVAVVTSSDAEAGGGTARVLIDRDPLIVALIPGLKALFGDERA